MKKLFLSFIAVSAFTLFSCEEGSSTLDSTTEATVEKVTEEVTEEPTPEVDSTFTDTLD